MRNQDQDLLGALDLLDQDPVLGVVVAPQPLGADVHLADDLVLAQCGLQPVDDFLDLGVQFELVDVQLEPGALAGKLVGQGEVVHLALDGEQAEDCRQRSVDVQGLVRHPLPFVLGHGGKGAQVVHPVGELDQHHLGLGGGAGEDLAVHHFLQVLPVTAVMGHLGAALDNGLHIGAELFPDQGRGDVLHVFHGVMQEGGSQDFGIVDVEFLGKDTGHIAGMDDIGIAGTPPLFAVRRHGKIQSAPEDLGLRPGPDQARHQRAVCIDIKFLELHEVLPNPQKMKTLTIRHCDFNKSPSLPALESHLVRMPNK